MKLNSWSENWSDNSKIVAPAASRTWQGHGSLDAPETKWHNSQYRLSSTTIIDHQSNRHWLLTTMNYLLTTNQLAPHDWESTIGFEKPWIINHWHPLTKYIFTPIIGCHFFTSTSSLTNHLLTNHGLSLTTDVGLGRGAGPGRRAAPGAFSSGLLLTWCRVPNSCGPWWIIVTMYCMIWVD